MLEGFSLRRFDEEPSQRDPEMLRQNFRKDIPGLEPPPADSGVDARGFKFPRGPGAFWMGGSRRCGWPFHSPSPPE